MLKIDMKQSEKVAEVMENASSKQMSGETVVCICWSHFKERGGQPWQRAKRTTAWLLNCEGRSGWRDQADHASPPNSLSAPSLVCLAGFRGSYHLWGWSDWVIGGCDRGT